MGNLMVDNPHLTEIYAQNTKEQYEAIGRFVEAFEAMVNEARQNSIQLLTRDHKQQLLLRIPFYNQALSAKPLFEIFRTLIAEIIHGQETQKTKNISQEDLGTYLGVLSTIAGEYMDLCSIRNNLLHGTWFVGYSGSDDPYCKEFFIHRFDATKKGLSLTELPKTASNPPYARGRMI
jgi:hypothetical protein